MQRALERRVRKYKRRYLAETAAGVDASQSAAKLKAARQQLSAFLDETGERVDGARTEVPGENSSTKKQTAYAAQAYRKDLGAASKITLFRRTQAVEISVKQVESYKSPVFVSDKASIKPKALHEINQHTEAALAEWGVSLDRKPKIVIVSDDELHGAVGIYDSCDNTVYYAESVGKKAVQDAAGGSGAIEAHEMWHMKQAEDFRQAGWTITRENRTEYLAQLCEKCKKSIDNLGITSDNVGEISEYAKLMYSKHRYDEVEAEYMTSRRSRQ